MEIDTCRRFFFFLNTKSRKGGEVSQIGNYFQRGFFIYLHVKAVGKGRKNKVMV